MFMDLVQENSRYGARFKSWNGGNGVAKKYGGCLLSAEQR